MNNLKNETVTKCFSLLREFIDETTGANSKKGVAILALTQLERVTAGSTSGSDPCIDTPLVDGAAGGGESSSTCIDTPLVDGAPAPGGG
jgi:hypothetical protein